MSWVVDVLEIVGDKEVHAFPSCDPYVQGVTRSCIWKNALAHYGLRNLDGFVCNGQ